jgi:hypothetical protein
LAKEFDIDVLRTIVDSFIFDTRCRQYSDIPEVNISNALSLMNKYNIGFQLTILPKISETRSLSLNFISVARVYGNAGVRGQLDYITNIPTGESFTPISVKAESRVLDPIEVVFDLSNNSGIDDLYSWACNLPVGLRHGDLIQFVTDLGIFEKVAAISDRLPIIKDSDMIALGTALEKITGESFMVPNNILYNTLSLAGHAKLWHIVSNNGFSDKQVPIELAKVAHNIAADKFRTDAIKILAVRESNKSTILYHVKSRLPEKVYADFISRSRPSMSGDELLSLLGDRDKDIITKSISDANKNAAALMNNACPHKKIHSKIVMAKDNLLRREILQEIEGYYTEVPSSSSESFIECSKCHFPLMCPHELIYQKGVASGKNTNEIKESLAGWIYPDKVLGNYTCRICGQIIISISAFDSVVTQSYENYDLGEDEERSAFWSDVNMYSKYIMTENLVSRTSFISTIVGVAYPFVTRAALKLGSAKGVSVEEVNAKKRIMSIIYIFACFINLAIKSELASNDRDVVKVSLTMPSDVKGKDLRSKMFHFAVSTIMRTQNINIRRIIGLTEEMIGQDLLGAYKELSTSGPVAQMHDSRSDDISWTHDSLYRYIVYHVLPLIRGPKDFDDNLDSILPPKVTKKTERSRKAIISRSIFTANTGHLVNVDSFKFKPFDRSSITYNKSAKRVDPGVLRAAFDDLWEKYSKLSFAFTINYLPIHAKPTYVNLVKPPSYKESIDEIGGGRTSDFNTKLKEYIAGPGAIIRSIEAELKLLCGYRTARYINPLPSTGTYYVPYLSPLGFIYGLTGHKRKWDKYKNYKKISGKWIKNSGEDKDIALWADCTGFTYKDAVVSNHDVMESIKESEKVDNMITFYEFRCPKGDSHDIDVQNNACIKCGLVPGKGDLEYYKKYVKEYLKDLEELAPRLNIIAPTIAIKSVAEYKDIGPLDFNKIIEAAKYCKIEPGALSSIGSSEGLDYQVIARGKFTAPIAYDKYASRITKLKAYCLLLITRYGQVVNMANSIDPSKEVSDLLAKVVVPSDLMSLEVFADNFVHKYSYIFVKKGPKEITDFLLESFAELLLKLRDMEVKHPTISSIFKWIINGPFYADRVVSKPQIVNWSAIIKVETEEIYDVNYDANAGIVMDEDVEETENNMDVEDESEDGNQIKVRDSAME